MTTRDNSLSRIRSILDLMPMRLTHDGGDSAFVEVSALLDSAVAGMNNHQIASLATRELDRAIEEFAHERSRDL